MQGIPRESIFYEHCWQCRCVVPNGLVQRQTVQTGYSSRPYQEHYEQVSLCGMCALQMEEEARARGQAQCRLWTVILGMIALMISGLPFSVSLLLMCALVWGVRKLTWKRPLMIGGHR